MKAVGHTEPQSDLLSLPFLLRELVTSLVLKWEGKTVRIGIRSTKNRDRRERVLSIVNVSKRVRDKRDRLVTGPSTSRCFSRLPGSSD